MSDFTPIPTKTPDAIIALMLNITKVGTPTEEQEEYTAKFDATIGFSDGSRERKSGDLIPHLTAAQVTGLKAMIDSLYVKAETEFLP